MADDYVISARIVAKDATLPGISAVEKRLDGIEKRALGFGDILGKGLALLGGAAGIGLGIKSMIGLNSEIDVAQRGLATLFSATTNMPIGDAFNLARSELALLRKDAKVGVGELSNYVHGYQAILGPGLAAGASTTELRELTKNSLAAGMALRGEEGLRLAPQDILQAITGGASRIETPIVMQALQAAGITADKFNKMNPGEKIDTLNEAFGKFGPGVELMGKSWSAQFSTLTDNVKETIRTVTSPLFERWTEQLRGVNDWLAKNEERISRIATEWGTKLVQLWDHLIAKAGIYAGLVGAAGIAKAAPGIAGAVGGAGSIASGIGGALGGTGGLAVLAVLAQGFAVISIAAYSLYDAFAAWPRLLQTVQEASAPLGESFGRLGASLGDLWATLTQFGAMAAEFPTVFTYLGLVIGVAVAAFAGAVDGIVRGVNVLVMSLSMLLTNMQFGALQMQALFDGDFAKVAMYEAAARAYNDKQGTRILDEITGKAALKEVLGRGAGARAVAGATGTGDPAVTPPSVTNFTGPVTIIAKTELNADPARVAVAVEEVLTNLEQYRKQPRRPVRPTGA